MDARYDPSDIEAPLYDEWLRADYFKPKATGGASPYVIVIPPPNVTAALHMGHGLNNTIQDVLIRWRRMQGRPTLWVPGTDHAGIATQNVVERVLKEEGCARSELGRERFVARVWEWVDEYGGRIIRQLKAIGCSCDWSRTRFTLDEGLSKAVREVFVRLYEKDLIYRGRYIINWCPRCGTALSNEETEHREQEGRLYRIRYSLAGDPKREVEVATTRPETMLGDTALAVHPDDDRYRDLVGREAILPLVGRRLPIVADPYVDPEFGTGIVKVTPAHDPNDFEIAGRHGLPAIDVMTDEATLGEEAPETYRGLDRFEARRRVADDLEREARLAGVEPHTHSVGHCYRCDTIVEPRLSRQWFVRMKPLAAPALAAYREGRLRFRPERYGRIYAHWLENIRDWCVSRQLWWGHRIPVWYCQNPDCLEMVVSREDPDRCPSCRCELEQDSDVLDTWFSSWLWPFSTLGWPDDTEDLRSFYPTSTLVTAPDILFFWVARMVMAGLEFMGELPFTEVLLNGTVRDHLGRRMSKSLGNGIDPMEVVERFGADAMRFTLVRGAALGTDLQLNYEDLDTTFRVGRNFANKIWNAARLALPHVAERDAAPLVVGRLQMADRWILSRFHAAAGEVTSALEDARFNEAAEACYHFVWGDFCDWYLELVKGRLEASAGPESRTAATHTLWHVMLGWLRLLHPILPFVTEAIARRLPGADFESLVPGPWPSPPAEWVDEAALESMAEFREMVRFVRTVRSEYTVQPDRKVSVLLQTVSPGLRAALEAEGKTLERLAGISKVTEIEGRGNGDGVGRHEPGAHGVMRSGTSMFIPLTGVIDLARERQRLAGERDRLDALLSSCRLRLENASFRAKAPAEVVTREQEKLRSLTEQRRRLSDKLHALADGG